MSPHDKKSGGGGGVIVGGMVPKQEFTAMWCILEGSVVMMQSDVMSIIAKTVDGGGGDGPATYCGRGGHFCVNCCKKCTTLWRNFSKVRCNTDAPWTQSGSAVFNIVPLWRGRRGAFLRRIVYNVVGLYSATLLLRPSETGESPFSMCDKRGRAMSSPV